MDEALARAQELLSRWDEELARILPADTRVFDAHVHLGNDIDGMVGVLDELLRIQDRYRIDRAFMFCLGRAGPGTPPPRRQRPHAGVALQSDRRLIPFVRLDLSESPIEEAVRCLDRGARGSSCTRARAQGFLLNDERLAPVFALAAERHVPILITADAACRRCRPPGTAGRGESGLATGHRTRRHRRPRGADGQFAGKAGVFFDTSAGARSTARLLPPGTGRADPLRLRLSIRTAGRTRS